MPTTALIADDEPHLARHLAEQLGRLWPELQIVAMARNGVEAAQQIEALQPDFAFLDIRMPGMTGLELLEIITQKYPHIHVSMISAYGEGDNHRRAMASGAKEFFTKPIDFGRLKQEVHAQIGQQKQG